MIRDSEEILSLDNEDDVGIATGNWGCGAFGGDPEVKTIIQWLAASQVVLSQALKKQLNAILCHL